MELAILLGLSFLIALTLALIVFLKKKRKPSNPIERAIDVLQQAYGDREISSEEFLQKCHDLSEKKETIATVIGGETPATHRIG
jgi:uncharacterized membrane protein